MKHEDFNYAAFEVGRLYTRDEVADTGGVARRQPRDWSGITQFKNCWLLWVTLDKSKKQANHRYNDCFVDDGRTLLWDSQNRHHLASPEILRILDGEDVVLMARTTDFIDGKAPPFCFCGPLTNPISGNEERPVRFRFDVPMHADPSPHLAELFSWTPDGPRAVSTAETAEQPRPATKKDTKRASRGQGRVTDAEFKRAVEKRAVSLAMEHYQQQGWSVEDVGVPGNPFDLLCERGNETLRVEVKGTSNQLGSVNVTAGEVASARDPVVQTDLIIVHGINVVSIDDELVGEGGELRSLEPWIPAESDLTPTMFRYEVPDS